MMGTTHSRTSEAAVFVTTALLLKADPWLATVSWLPPMLKEWLSVPSALRGGAGAGVNSATLGTGPTLANTGTTSLTLSLADPARSVSQLGNSSLTEGAREWGTISLTLFFIWLLANFAGQLPDIDTPGSRSANSFDRLGIKLGSKHNLLLKILFGTLNFIPQSISWFASTFMQGHRGIVHSLPFTVLVAFGFGALCGAIPVLGTPFYGTLFGVAFATHLFVDAFTKVGIKPFAPFLGWKFHLLPFGFTLESSSAFWNTVMQIAAVLISLTAFLFGIVPALVGNG